MLSRVHRFHGHNSLRYAYQHGRTVRGPQLAIKYALNNRRQQFRAAVVVSTKVSKLAVVRNRIRRRLYGLLRNRQADISAPFDIIITVFDDKLAALPNDKLAALLYGQLSQAGILPATRPRGIVEEKEF